MESALPTLPKRPNTPYVIVQFLGHPKATETLPIALETPEPTLKRSKLPKDFAEDPGYTTNAPSNATRSTALHAADLELAVLEDTLLGLVHLLRRLLRLRGRDVDQEVLVREARVQAVPPAWTKSGGQNLPVAREEM